MYTPKNPICFADTKDMPLIINGVVQKDAEGKPILDEKIWLSHRKGIGGSDTAAILGISPWRSVTEIWDEKRGIKPLVKKNMNQLSLDIGHMAEPYIRFQVVPYLLKLQGITDFAIEDITKMLRHGNPEYDFAFADFDGLIRIGKKVGVLELKTTKFNNHSVDAYWKKGLVPPYYMTQLRHYMAVGNLDFAYICCIWGIDPEAEAALVRIERDMTLEAELMDAEKKFWDENVKKNIRPDETGLPETVLNYQARRQKWDDNKDDAVDCSKLKNLIRDRELVLDTLGELEKDITNKKNELKFFDSEILKALDFKQYGYCDLSGNESARIYVNQNKSNSTYDIPSIKQDFPDIFEKGASLVLNRLSKEEKAAIKKYKIPGEENGNFKLSVKIDKKVL